MRYNLKPSTTIRRDGLMEHLAEMADSYAQLQGHCTAEATYAARNGGSYMSKGKGSEVIWFGPFTEDYCRRSALEWQGSLWAMIVLAGDLEGDDRDDVLTQLVEWFAAVTEQARASKLAELTADGQPKPLPTEAAEVSA